MLRSAKDGKSMVLYVVVGLLLVSFTWALQNVTLSVDRTFNDTAVIALPSHQGVWVTGSYDQGSMFEVYVNSSVPSLVAAPADPASWIENSTDWFTLHYVTRASPQLVGSFIDVSIDTTYSEHACVEYSTGSCYGDPDCCGFVDLSSSGPLSSVLGITSNMSTIAARMLYVDAALGIINSTEWVSLPISFYTTVPFNGYSNTSGNIVVDVDGGAVFIDEITYSRDIVSSLFSNGNVTLGVTNQADFGFPAYLWHSAFIYANYTYTGNSTVISDGVCNLTLPTYNILQQPMPYSASVGAYLTNVTFNSTGQYSYSVNCGYSQDPSYDAFQEDNITIVKPTVGFVEDTGNSFTGVQKGSVVFVDFNGDGMTDIVTTGLASSVQSLFYQNTNGTLFLQNNSWRLDPYQRGASSWTDFDNDGDLDIIVCGDNGTRIAKIYENTLNSLTLRQQIQGVRDCSVSAGDFDGDGLYDFFLSGSNGTGTRITRVYKNQESFIFTLNQSLEGIESGSIVPLDINNDGLLDLFITGLNGSSTEYSRVYTNNQNSYTLTQDLANPTGTVSAAAADFDNDGWIDVVIAGTTDLSNTGANLTFYRNNGGILSSYLSIDGFYRSSTVWGDYDSDGFFDLLVSGRTSSNLPITKLYLNNKTSFKEDTNQTITGVEFASNSFYDFDSDSDLDMLVSGLNGASLYNILFKNNNSLVTANSIPLPSSSLSTSRNSTHITFIWSAGSDRETNSSGLYYNLRVGTLPGKHDVVSGVRGASSNPTNGYLGNMMQRKNISLSIANQTYYWSVQTIDTGLQASNWSVEQVSDPCIIPSSEDWVVTTSCTKLNLSINGPANRKIVVNGGTLRLIGSNLTVGSGSNITVVSGSLIMIDSRITGNGYGFVIYNGTTAHINGSSIIGAGSSNTFGTRGVEINGTVQFNRDIIVNGYNGLVAYASDSTYRDVNVTGSSNYDAIIQASNVNLTNISMSLTDVVGSFNRNWLVTVNVTDNTSVALSDVRLSAFYPNGTLAKEVVTSNGVGTLELTQYINTNNINSYFDNYTVTLNKTYYFSKNLSWNVTGNALVKVNITRSLEPIWNNFQNNLTSNFTGLSDYTNLSNVTIGIPGYGMINYTGTGINIEFLDLDAYVKIEPNLISINTNALPSLNTTAKLTLYNLNYTKTPEIKRDGQLCGAACSSISYSAGTLAFNVAHFSNYTTVSNSQLNYTVTSSLDGKIVPNETVFFKLNFSGLNGSDITDAVCNMTFSDSISRNTSFVNNLYVANRSFTSTANLTISAVCNQSSTYEGAQLSTSFTIYDNTTTFVKDDEQGLVDTFYQNSFVFGDYDGDDLIDFLICGNFYPGNEINNILRTCVLYDNRQPLINSTDIITGIYKSTVGFVDIDNNGDLEVFINGDSSSGAVAEIYTNS